MKLKSYNFFCFVREDVLDDDLADPESKIAWTIIFHLFDFQIHFDLIFWDQYDVKSPF